MRKKIETIQNLKQRKVCFRRAIVREELTDRCEVKCLVRKWMVRRGIRH